MLILGQEVQYPLNCKWAEILSINMSFTINHAWNRNPDIGWTLKINFYNCELAEIFCRNCKFSVAVIHLDLAIYCKFVTIEALKVGSYKKKKKKKTVPKHSLKYIALSFKSVRF